MATKIFLNLLYKSISSPNRTRSPFWKAAAKVLKSNFANILRPLSNEDTPHSLDSACKPLQPPAHETADGYVRRGRTSPAATSLAPSPSTPPRLPHKTSSSQPHISSSAPPPNRPDWPELRGIEHRHERYDDGNETEGCEQGEVEVADKRTAGEGVVYDWVVGRDDEARDSGKVESEHDVTCSRAVAGEEVACAAHQQAEHGAGEVEVERPTGKYDVKSLIVNREDAEQSLLERPFRAVVVYDELVVLQELGKRIVIHQLTLCCFVSTAFSSSSTVSRSREEKLRGAFAEEGGFHHLPR
ncbi:hypothetical protein IEQ34_006745 [Dendrobium chrysotoxum]|uniref:Uncharacterized protein n=1 Tax=Dendrobium chrysotoxum TaxID=161865 RepID=A0AAV7H7C4_DENCH|nr:hypothetical protein IEQ34_006745 [Dendrobium chrysotoxum]